jgi:hypothetical protein
LPSFQIKITRLAIRLNAPIVAVTAAATIAAAIAIAVVIVVAVTAAAAAVVVFKIFSWQLRHRLYIRRISAQHRIIGVVAISFEIAVFAAAACQMSLVGQQYSVLRHESAVTQGAQRLPVPLRSEDEMRSVRLVPHHHLPRHAAQQNELLHEG